jgi:predicted  nucleic acid-binding Zn-ribbon protein
MAASELEDGIVKERITQLEDAVLDLSAEIQHQRQLMRDMQQMIIKIATNQQQLAERVATWPFIKIDSAKQRRPPPKPIDE